MRYIRNNRGVALVMALVFAMVGLAIVSAMMFMITQGTMMSGAGKQYRSADDAGLGATDIVVQYVQNVGVPPNGLNILRDGRFDANFAPCLNQKMTGSRGNWTGAGFNWPLCEANTCSGGTKACNITELDLPTDADLQFLLPGDNNRNFAISTKIIDTVKGNTDASGAVSGGKLGGEAVTAAGSGIVSPPTYPSMYRVDVQTQDQLNPSERSRYSVLYAY